MPQSVREALRQGSAGGWVLLFETGGLAPPAPLLALLSPEELDRMARFRLERRREQYAWGRLSILAAGAVLAPPGVRPALAEKPPLSPDLLVGEVRFHGSVSHCRNRVAVMLSPHPCGVDIEWMDAGRALEGCARVAFGREAAAGIAALGDPVTGFYRAWGTLECAVKIGRRDVFSVRSGVGWIESCDLESEAAEGWMLVTARPAGTPPPVHVRASLGDFCRILTGLAREG